MTIADEAAGWDSSDTFAKFVLRVHGAIRPAVWLSDTDIGVTSLWERIEFPNDLLYTEALTPYDEGGLEFLQVEVPRRSSEVMFEKKIEFTPQDLPSRTYSEVPEIDLEPWDD